MKTHHDEAGFKGLSAKIRGSLAALLESSKQLQKAIITKDVDSIWKILAHQQEKLNEFEQYNYLWSQLIASGVNTPELPALKEEINSDIKMIRATGNSNSKMIMSFLAAIRKALKETGTNIAKKTKIYGKTGKMQIKQVSLKVSCTG